MNDYRIPTLPPSERAAALLTEMTREEKIGQLLCLWAEKEIRPEADGGIPSDVRRLIARGGVGLIAQPSMLCGSPRELAACCNALQRAACEESRLGIPLITIEECLHGVAAPGNTSFPQAIALASTWNPELVERVYRLTGQEAAAQGARQALTPLADVARDPRWGRTEETFGEDPYLASCFAAAAVAGLQGGRSGVGPGGVGACLKHFAAYSQPEAGTNCGPANLSERVLREVFFPPFQHAIAETRPAAVMAGYHEVDGLPVHANSWLLRDVLRGELGFEGLVVSDYFGIIQLIQRHCISETPAAAAIEALRAGVDVELPQRECYPELLSALDSGMIREADLDAPLLRLLRLKFELGLFESPYVDLQHAESFCGSEQHRALALQAALESAVLLQNRDEFLPLKKAGVSRLAVIGPNADRRLLGGYSGRPRHYATVLDGFRDYLGSAVEVVYAEGCGLTQPGDWTHVGPVELSDPSEDRRKIDAAVQTAAAADAVVLVLGGNELTEREAWAEIRLGDRSSLKLVGLQEELAEAVAAQNSRCAVLLINGGPLDVSGLTRIAPAVLECWYSGQEAGRAAAQLLFGEVSPSGRLPITFPRSSGHLPCYYNYKPSDRRGYVLDEVSPLYAFGSGLSYTQFQLSDVRLETAQIRIGEATTLRCRLRNTGQYAGAEVVQLYVRDCCSSVTRPVRELKGFRKVRLEAGSASDIEFEIGTEQLQFYTRAGRWEVEPGSFELLIGTSARREDLIVLELEVLA